MAHPFFEAIAYPWDRPEAVVFFHALYSTVRDPSRIDFYYSQCGPDLKPLPAGPADDIWKAVLEQLTAARQLSRFCTSVLLADQSIAAIHQAVRVIIAAGTIRPVVAGTGVQTTVTNGVVVGATPDLINRSRPYFEEAEGQLNGTADKKELHKWLHRLQDEFYLRLRSLYEQFPASIPELSRHLRTVRRDMTALRHIVGCPALASLDVQGIEADLSRIMASIQSAVETKSNIPLQESVFELDRLLGNEMPKIDQAMTEAAYILKLDELAKRLDQIAQQYPAEGVDSTDAQKTLALHQSIQKKVAAHRAWQKIDNQVREFEQSIARPIDELKLKWRILKRLLLERVNSDPQSEWAIQLAESIGSIDTELETSNSGGLRVVFIEIRAVTGEKFAEADEELLVDFNSLREIATRIAALLRRT